MIMLQHLTTPSPHSYVGQKLPSSTTTPLSASPSPLRSPTVLIQQRDSRSLSPVVVVSSPKCTQSIKDNYDEQSNSPQPMTIVEDEDHDQENDHDRERSSPSPSSTRGPTINHNLNHHPPYDRGVIIHRRRSITPDEIPSSPSPRHATTVHHHHQSVVLYNHLRQCKTPPLSASPTLSPQRSEQGSPARRSITQLDYHPQQLRRSVITGSSDEPDPDDDRILTHHHPSVDSNRHSYTTDDSEYDVKVSNRLKNEHSKQICNRRSSNPDEEDEDDDRPLDLSVGRRRARTYSNGTDSDDSGAGAGDSELHHKGQGRAAYKKSLMKRYCKLRNYLKSISNIFEIIFNKKILMPPIDL